MTRQVLAGVSPALIQKWHGVHSAAFILDVYARLTTEDLPDADTLFQARELDNRKTTCAAEPGPTRASVEATETA